MAAKEQPEWVVTNVLRVTEVQAALSYVSSRAISGIECTVVERLTIALDEFLAAPAEESGSKGATVLELYCSITKITYEKHEVNGRTILASESPIKSLSWMIAWTFLFFMFVLFTQFYGPTVEALEETFFEDPSFMRIFLTIFGDEVLPYIEPFFWGGLGSCIYLLKRYNDYVAEHQLDKAKLPGYTARVALGAILAVVVVNLFFDPTAEADGIPSFPWTGDAVAFLCGVGVRAVYGALEKAVERLHELFTK
jgi:hypothetical protein